MSDSPTLKKLSAEEFKFQFVKACELQENNKLHDALSIYSELEQFIPESPLINFNMGLARFDLQEFKKAEVHYLIAARENPNDPDIHYNQGLNYRRLGRIQDAVASFSQAVKLGDSTVDTFYNIGLCYQELDEFDKASDMYEMALSKNQEHLSTLNNYAYLCHKREDLTKAKELYGQLLLLNPEHKAAQHMLNSLTGKTPETAPLEYVEAVFDGYAETFEDKLLKDLAYQTPQELWKDYSTLFTNAKERNCLDLGCGTGLAGAAFAPCCSKLTGVDISDEILKVADKKGLYTTLIKDDILSFLENSNLSFDLILAADVFTYLGDLEPVIKACSGQIEMGGVLCFSVEESEQDSFMLKGTGRFGHSLSYIEHVCQKTGWTILSSQHSQLRQEKKEWVYGYLFILQKCQHR